MEDKSVMKNIPLDDSIEEIRNEFPLTREKIYFNSCSKGLLSNRVASSLEEYVESWKTEGSPWENWMGKLEELRSLFAGMIGAEEDEVAITYSASTAISAVASSFDYKIRNEVLLGDLEFPTVVYIWFAQAKRGAFVKRIYSRSHRIEPEYYMSKLTENTLIVPLTHVCYKSGYKTDVTKITDNVHKYGAYVFLDSYQLMGTERINVRDLGIDFLVSGALKYLLGTSGLAFLYIRKELVENLEPVQTGWLAQKNPFDFDIERVEYALAARRFESGTPPIPAVFAALEGLKILDEIGMDTIKQRIESLTGYLLEGLQELKLKILTPLSRDERGPLVVFEAKEPEKTVLLLKENNIIASSRGKGVRISLHFYNTKEEIDVLLKVLGKNISSI